MTKPFVTVEPNTVWPHPHDPLGVERRLRYYPDTLNRDDMVVAASYISAYRALVCATTARRAEIVRVLREAGVGE